MFSVEKSKQLIKEKREENKRDIESKKQKITPGGLKDRIMKKKQELNQS